MKRLVLLTFALVACDGSVTDPAARPSLDVGASIAGVCLPTTFIRDGRALTAALIGTPAPITRTVVDATGCDIGIYYPPGITGSESKQTS